MHSFLSGISLGLGSVHQSAVVFVSAITVKSIFDISMIDHALSDISVEALGEGIGVAVRAWFSILGEGVDQSSSISDDGGLSTGDGVDHLLGGAVEVHGNLLSFFGLSFSLEPVGPLVGVVLEVLPVDGGGDVTMVVAVVLDIDSVSQKVSSKHIILAFFKGRFESIPDLLVGSKFLSIASSIWSISWILWIWFPVFPSGSVTDVLHSSLFKMSIPVSSHGFITWCLNVCLFFFLHMLFIQLGSFELWPFEQKLLQRWRK